MIVQNHVAEIRNAMFSAQLATSVLHLSMSHTYGGSPNLDLSHCIWLSLELLSCTVPVYIDMRQWSDINGCTYFTGRNKEVSRCVSAPGRKIGVLVWSSAARPVSSSLTPVQ